MNIFYVLMPLLFLFSFQDTSKNVLSSGQDTSVTLADIDSCDFRMDTAYAGHLYREAKVMMDSGEYELALRRLEGVEEFYLGTSGKMDTLLTKIYYLKGAILMKLQNLDEALSCHKKGLKTGINAYGYNHRDVAELFRSIGFIWYYKGNYSKALDALQKVLDIKMVIYEMNDPEIAKTLINIGVMWKSKGDLAMAINCYNKSVGIFLASKENHNVSIGSVYNNIGAIWNSKGDFNKALLFFKKSLNIFLSIEGENDHRVALLFNNIGAIWQSLGDYDKAIEYFFKALNIYDENNVQRALPYNNIGGAFIYKGRYEKALKYLNLAKKMLISNYGNNYPQVASVYDNIGIVLQNKGLRNKALNYYKQSLNIKLDVYNNLHPEIASSYDNIGTQFAESDQYDEALKYYKKSLHIYKKNYGNHHPDIAAVYKNIGLSNLYNNDILLANEFFSKAMIAVNYNYKVPYQFQKVNSPYILLKILKSKRTYYFFNYRKNNNPIYLDSLREHDRVLLSLDDYLQKIFSSASAKQFYSDKSLPVYEGAIDNLIVRDKKEELPQSFQIAEKLKSRQLSEKMKNAAFSTSFGIPDSLKEQEYDLGVDIAFYEKKKFKEEYESQEKNDSLIGIYDDNLFDLNRQREDLQGLLKKDYTNYYNARYSQQVISVTGVQDSLLNPDQALVEYFVGDSSIFTFTILTDTFYVHQIKKDFPLDTLVEDMLHGIYDPFTPGSDTLDRKFSIQQAASLIYQKVFHYVDTLLPDGTDIILVPDGILGYIPFDALLTDSTDSESYLIRDHQISYAYSATLQAEMEKMEHDHQAQKKILAFAPSFDHTETTGDTNMLASRFIDVSNTRNWLGPLKYNDDEVRIISQMVPSDVFMDSTATKDQFLQNASDYSIIHLSTHGKANDKMGDYSFLAFYDPKDSTETWLYNRELYGLKLNADMVVLSACETGIGELQRGEGIISLARGFSYAGAKSIITTLWSVNDRSTQKVMELFYGNLAEGMPKDAALRQAKLDYLDEYPHLGKSPYFWAGIIPIGDMSPISFQAIWYQNPWYWLGGLLLLTLGIWGYRKIF